MMILLKWILRAFLFSLAIGFTAAIAQGFENIYSVDGIIAVVFGSAFLGIVFYFLEVKWIPKRKAALTTKVMSIFDSLPVSENVTHFKFGGTDVYTELELNLTFSKNQGSLELVTFHVPRSQGNNLHSEHRVRFPEDECNGMPTYRIYQTNGMGLKLAKKRLSGILR